MIQVYTFLSKMWVLIFILTLSFSASAEEYCEREWLKSFYKYSTPEKLDASAGFLVKSGPCDSSDTIKTGFGNPEVVGYLDSDGARYYMSPWSYNQAIKGKDPNWIRLKAYDATAHYHSKNADRYQIEFYDNPEKIYAHYFEVKTEPKTTSETIKTASTPTVGVVGYVDTKDGRFYITQWSWDRALTGKPPYWVYIPSISPRYLLPNVIEEEEYSPKTQTHPYSNTPVYTRPYVSYSSPKKQRAIVCLGQLTAKGLVKKYVKNKVVAFAIEETINAFVTKEISLESVAASAITSFVRENIKSKLQEKGQSFLANALDITKLVMDFAACMGTATD